MPIEIKMPQLSDTMSSGKIVAWRKKEGDLIERGDILAEVETDKANLEIESFQKGTLLKINIPAGSVATVGDIIAFLGNPGESVGTSSASTVTHAAQAPTPQVAATSPVASQPQATIQNSHQQSPQTNGRIKASPLAKKIAAQMNLELANIQGSGPEGRITKKDIELAATKTNVVPLSNYTPQRTQSEATNTAQNFQSSAAQAPIVTGSGKLVPFSRMRETIARRMQESVTQAPHFYVSTSIDMTQSLQLREVLKNEAEYKGISVNHFVLKAAAYGLAKEPKVNCAVKDGQVFHPAQINIGIITAIEDGLLIPVIKDADKLSLKDLVFEARAAVERARAGRPNSNDLTGGTFSISNMGMFDVDNFTAIINPGQGGILAVGSIKATPVVKNNQMVIADIMKVTVSVDHRVIDGVMAGTFLKYFKQALELPALLM